MRGRSSTALGITLAIALGAGLLAAGRPVGPRITRAIGGDTDPRLTFDVSYADGPVPLDDVGPVWRRRLIGYGVSWEARGPMARVTVHGAHAADAAVVALALTRPGRIEMYAVINDAPVMRDAFRDATGGRWPGVDADTDGWRHDDSGTYYTDYFLHSETLADLTAAIAQIPLPDEEAIVVERVAPSRPSERHRPFWRTYLVGGRKILGNAQIANAVTIWDPQTNRPEVLVELDAEGTRAFADATRALVGRKLAIVIDGVVSSAPVIQAEIAGGRSNIAMGGGTADEQQAEADGLVATLRGSGPPLPVGLSAILVSSFEPPASTAWAVRLGTAAFAGVAVWLLAAWMANRRWLEPARGAARSIPAPSWRVALAVAVTLAVPVLLWLVERIHLPGVHKDAGVAQLHLSIVSFGPWPVLLAFGAVELLATVLPPLARVRRGNAEGRAAIDRIVLVLAVALSLAVAWNLSGLLASAELAPRTLDRALVVTSLVAGVMLWVVGARGDFRAGVCNGWALLLAVVLLRSLVRDLRQPHLGAGVAATIAGIVVISAAAAVALSSHRIAGRRSPAAGIAPVLALPTILAVCGLPYLNWIDRGGWLSRPIAGLSAVELMVVIAVVAAGLAGWGGARRPGALIAAVGFAVGIAALELLLPSHIGTSHPAAIGAVLGVALVELVAGAIRYARLGDGVVLAVLHDLDRADELVAVLAAAGIPAAIDGARTRAILRGFGSFAPVIVRVPASRLDEARLIPSPLHDPLVVRAAAVFE